MHSETTTPIALPDVPSSDRWGRWFCISLGVHLLTFLSYPILICGCHFHVSAVPVGFVPVEWGGFTLLTYRTLGERILAHLNTALALGWLYLIWDSNLQFAFR